MVPRSTERRPELLEYLDRCIDRGPLLLHQVENDFDLFHRNDEKVSLFDESNLEDRHARHQIAQVPKVLDAIPQPVKAVGCCEASSKGSSL